MADQRRTGEQTNTGTAMKRRGILAAAGAVVAGIVAKQASQSVAATDQPWILGSIFNFGAATTYLRPNSGYTDPSLLDISMTTLGGTDVHAIVALGKGTGAGITATGGSSGVGVSGTGGGAGSTGVVGHGGSGDADGVRGTGSGVFSGVAGFGGNNGGAGIFGFGGLQGTNSTVGVGVVGTLAGYLPSSAYPAGTAGLSNVANVPGVYGLATVGNTAGVVGSGANGGAGVFGINSNIVGIGVQGFNDHGPAVQGNTSEGIGLKGVATTGLGASLQGGQAPLRLVPGAVAAASLSPVGHQVGELYVTSDNRLFFFTGSAWRELAFVPPAALPQPQPVTQIQHPGPAPLPPAQVGGSAAGAPPAPLPPARP